MPHQCTNCDLTFEDGSKQMLGGCPECGGNKFQFLPSSAEKRDSSAEASRPAAETEPTTAAESAAQSTEARTGPTATPSTSRSLDDADDIIEAPAEPVEAIPDGEDRAQASARSAVVSEDELSAAAAKPATTEATEDPPSPDVEPDDEERPDLSQLRKELNDQFESIKILQPGEYELNLMELYDRQEYIIALEEDGRYVIDVPDARLSED